MPYQLVTAPGSGSFSWGVVFFPLKMVQQNSGLGSLGKKCCSLSEGGRHGLWTKAVLLDESAFWLIFFLEKKMPKLSWWCRFFGSKKVGLQRNVTIWNAGCHVIFPGYQWIPTKFSPKELCFEHILWIEKTPLTIPKTNIASQSRPKSKRKVVNQHISRCVNVSFQG